MADRPTVVPFTRPVEPPDEQIVHELSELLEQAKAGKVRVLAYVAADAADGDWQWDFMGECSQYELNGRINELALGVLTDGCDEDDE